MNGHCFSTTPIRPGPPRWLRLIIWLVLDGIWALAAAVVLRSPQGSDRTQGLRAWAR